MIQFSPNNFKSASSAGAWVRKQGATARLKLASVLTATSKGPAASVEIHQASPQMALAARRGLVNSHRDASERGVCEFDPWDDSSPGVHGHEPLKALQRTLDRADGMTQVQPFL